MPTRRQPRPAPAIPLTRSEKKAAEIDSAVKNELEKSRAADLKKIARLKALRLSKTGKES